MRKLSPRGEQLVAPSGGYRSQDNRCQKGVKDDGQHADVQPDFSSPSWQLAGQNSPENSTGGHKQPELSCRLRIQQVSEHSQMPAAASESGSHTAGRSKPHSGEILAHGAQSHKQQQSDAEYRQVILEAERKAFQASRHAGYPVG